MDVRLDNVVLRTLEKQPERCYQHVSEVKTGVNGNFLRLPDMGLIIVEFLATLFSNLI